MTFIRIQQVNKNYGETRAVRELNLALRKSAITVLLGRSGCGKTTALRLIAGLEKPDSGSIWIGDRQVSGDQVWVSATQRQIGMVFQDYALFPHLTIAQNISFGISAMKTAERRERVVNLLALVGLTGVEERYPHQLSGGQQQRVALARALAPSPQVMLLDEPFSNLDASLRQTMREEVRAILHKAGVTTVFVTHDQEEALRLADELVIMDEGRALQCGPPETVYRYPASLRIARFLAQVNVLPGEAGQGVVETPLGRLPLHDPRLTGPVEVVLFPETISLTPDPQSDAWVEQISYFGFHQMLTLRLTNGATLQARAWSHTQLAIGDRVRVTVDTAVVAFAQK
jgi:iron(III) transport system ATP-binding protein